MRGYGNTLQTNRRFVKFTVSQFIFRSGLALALPLFPIYWVRNVNATDQAVSAINAAQTFMAMIGYFVWARASQRRGERPVLLAATLGLSFYPLLTALTGRAEVLILWAGLAGFFSAGVDLIFFDILLGTCPGQDQPAYVGMYQTTVFVAAFIAPLIGTALSDQIGIVPALIIASALRLLGFGLMAGLGVGKQKTGQPEEVMT